MNIEEARVLASRGAMLADGAFEFEGADASDFLQPPNAMVAIRDWPGRGTEFGLVGNARRDPDGLWSADWPVHSIALQSTVPVLERLLDYPSFAASSDGSRSDVVRFDLSAEHSAFAWVVLDSVYMTEPRREAIRGTASIVSIEAKRNADGFTFTIEATVDEPKRGEEQLAPIKVRATASLSFATMALAGSSLWWRGGPDCWGNPQRAEGGEKLGPLAAALTLDRAGGTPFFKGTLELGPNLPDVYRGTWVQAQVYGRRMILRPQREPTRLAGGFCSGMNMGPDLVLHNFGPETWAELLADSDEGELIQSGSGIGFSQRVTGRDVGDEGPHEQPITMLRTRLRRAVEGLAVSLIGELGPIRQKNPHHPPLGPDFGVEFVVPTQLLFVRGIVLGGMYQERQQRFVGLEKR